MEGPSAGLASALRAWINTFDLPREVVTWQDLEDGQILWHVLRDIDPDYFTGSLPEQTSGTSKDSWIARWQNLKHIDRRVTAYIRDECGQLENLTRNMNPDLKSIATDGSPEQTIKLVESVLFAALFSEVSNERMAGRITELGENVGLQLQKAISDAVEADVRMAEDGYTQQAEEELDDHPPRGGSLDRDPELEHEERLLEAYQRNKELEDKVRLLAQEARERDEELADTEKRRRELEDELERRHQHGISSAQDEAAGLSQNTSDYIADLELQLQNEQSRVAEQERQIERFQADSATKQQVKDELQLMKAERDELAQKAKAAENLRKKIQVLQEQERAAAAMRTDMEVMKDQLQEAEALKERIVQLQKANEEKAKAIANGEQTIFDQKTNRQRLEYENQVIKQRYDQVREQQSQLQEQLKEQEERIHELEGSSPGHEQLESLDDELDENKEPKPKVQPVRRSTLSSTTGTDALLLQQRLDAQQYRLQDLEEKFLNVFQENLGLRDTIEHGERIEHLKETSYFMRKTVQYEDASKELETVRSKYIAATSEIADYKHRLEVSQSGDSNANVEALKVNKERQEYTERTEQELAEYKQLLETALRSGLEHLKSPDVRDSKEYKLIRHQISAVREARAEDAEQVVDNTSARLADKQLRGWLDLQEMTKIKDEQATQISTLQQQLQSAKQQPTATATSKPDAATQQEMSNLRRENKLLTSAWYDLTSRLQSNTVVLQRRGEAPKSWLGRQRAAVNQGAQMRR